MIVHVHYCFQVCLFIFNLRFVISTLNLKQMVGRRGGSAAGGTWAQHKFKN